MLYSKTSTKLLVTKYNSLIVSFPKKIKKLWERISQHLKKNIGALTYNQNNKTSKETLTYRKLSPEDLKYFLKRAKTRSNSLN